MPAPQPYTPQQHPSYAPPPGWAPMPSVPPPAGTPTSVVVLGGLVVALALVVVALMVSRGSGRTRTDDFPSSPTSGGDRNASHVGPCRMEKEPRRLAGPLHAAVPLRLAGAPGSTRIAVGYADSPTSGVGLTLDPATLDADQPFKGDSGRPIVDVVPIVAEGKLGFSVDRDDSGLAFGVSVDARPRFLVGMGGSGFARKTASSVDVLWAVPSDQKITTPRIETVDGVGHAVGFRRGGQDGSLVVGWLEPDGRKKSELSVLTSSGKPLVGTPSLASNDKRLLVSFAARASATAPWNLELGTAAHGAVPTSTTTFSIPPGGPGGEAISPAAGGLTGDRWLLSWTEGAQGNRVVRVQALGSDLIPAGNALSVSPEAANAGQSVVWVRGETAVVLFLSQKGRSHELWGTTLRCR